MEFQRSCHCCRRCPKWSADRLLFCILFLLVQSFFQLFALFPNKNAASASAGRSPQPPPLPVAVRATREAGVWARRRRLRSRRRQWRRGRRGFLYCYLGLAVSTVLMWMADLGSRSNGRSNDSITKYLKICLVPFTFIRHGFISIISSGNCPPSDIWAARIGRHTGYFALFNCLVLGHTKYKGMQQVNSIHFHRKVWESSHGPHHDSAAGHQ